MKPIQNPEFSGVISDRLTFSSAYKMLKQKGNLVYEYNPFRNYRLSKSNFEYLNKLYSLPELKSKFNIRLYIDQVEIKDSNEITDEMFSGKGKWEWRLSGKPIPSISECPILRKKGELVDFETDELNFDLKHPVSIVPQYSYDGSVNLILNDGKNSPRLINSRFSPLGKNKYQIVDRKGDNDTNIYDLGAQFDVDTSLYKKTNFIPKLTFFGTFPCGNLFTGVYHFYFKYMDADGNETDFISESGMVPVFIGDEPYNIYSGFLNLNSYKGLSFLLQNLDNGYQYISVYYTKASSDIRLESVTHAYKILQKYIINTANMCLVKITGFENVEEIPLYAINTDYQIASKVETLETCLNMLFFGNISKKSINYRELTDISLRILPTVEEEDYIMSNKISADYETKKDYLNSYYNPKFIYNKTGYWPDEIYRFGIVYILSDNTLSPVFNVRGIKELTNNIDQYSKYPFYIDGLRNYISFDEETNLLISDNKASQSQLENCKGTVKIKDTSGDSNHAIYSIKFHLDNTKECLQELDNLGIRGFFFVRLKRIPTTLCQAYTIGIDKHSHTPVIPFKEGSDKESKYIAECFLDLGKLNKSLELYLIHDYINRVYKINKTDTDIAAICPDYDVNSEYLNILFNGDKFTIVKDALLPTPLKRLSYEDRYYYTNSNILKASISEVANIQAVEDNVKLVAIDDIFFAARAGEAEEAFRYEYVKSEVLLSNATNLVRGSFGPYLGFRNLSFRESLINIKVPNYNVNNLKDYFSIRYNDKSPYYAIGDRYSIDTLAEAQQCYRGDCYICLFTHRVNRNFQDPTSPINDKIVDLKCWKDNYEVSDGVVKVENFDKINLGDVNAVELGQWITFTVRSTFNLNLRALDDSIPDETALTGHPRTFFPNCPLTPKGSYKVPESLCYNKGFLKSLSERENFEVPDIPAIKNDFTNRISYSDIHVNDAFKNGFRTFQGNHYRDYPKTYGLITKLIEFRGNLICVFEHGIAIIPVNERALAGEGAGGSVYINTSNVLPLNPKIISGTFGSLWKDSIIKTDKGVYGVDTVAKKIWRTDGNTFECISDFKILEFLNKNISLSEREITPVVGIRNVKTHFNKFKEDIMFTFYDNLYGLEEKVWNICYNELLNKWITFYSWVPSYSENIYNQFFSFDRNTSKYIAKLGISKYGNDFSDGVTLSNNIISEKGLRTLVHLSNRVLPEGDGITLSIEYELAEDNYGNYKLFDGDLLKRKGILQFTGNYLNIKSEFYKRNPDGSVLKDERGRKIWLPREEQINPDKIALYLNIKANIKVGYDGLNPTLGEAYATGFVNKTIVDAGYYLSVVAIIPEYNMLFLTTDFWKHGQAGIINIADNIVPSNWYGKVHPFEFEFVVSDNPWSHKIFDALEIISNNAEPESFHYEVTGDCYEFAKDKKNMYIRQEATKELYLHNGMDVIYDRDYNKLKEELRPSGIDGIYDKSTILPLYYSRLDTINEIEDFYHLKDNEITKDFSSLAGGEIIHLDNRDEYHLWNHTKAVDLHSKGRLLGNMEYKEDKWKIQINPINLVLKNESKWNNNLIPIELNLSPIPDEVLHYADMNNGDLNIPENSKNRDIVVWNWEESLIKEVKLKDKWIKIRIRYSGNKLAIISAIKTLYSISYA